MLVLSPLHKYVSETTLKPAANSDGSITLPEKDEVVVGKANTCDLQLDLIDVSSRHAVLRRDGKSVFVTDGYNNKPSRYGTTINGEPVSRITVIKVNDQICFSSAGFIVKAINLK